MNKPQAKVVISVGANSYSPNEFLTIAQVAKHLQMERQSVSYYISGRGAKKNPLRTIEIAGISLIAKAWLEDWEVLRGLSTLKGARDVKNELAEAKAKNDRLEAELAKLRELAGANSDRITKVLGDRKEQGLSGIGDKALVSAEAMEAINNLSPEAQERLDEEHEAFMQTAEYRETLLSAKERAALERKALGLPETEGDS